MGGQGWRSAPLPRNWPTIRKRILARDGHRCTMAMPDGTRCTEEATDVDHMGAATDHRDEMLRSLCGWHHRKRTAAQASAARVRVKQKHPSEKHPGLR